jgi:hypothetical protein
MRWIIGAFALTLAVPAQAQYTVSISGTGVYNPAGDSGDVSGVLATYGTNITYSVSFMLDRGERHLEATGFALQYFGHMLSTSVNGINMPLLGADQQSNLFLSDTGGNPFVGISLINASVGTTDDAGVVSASLQFIPTSLNGNAIPDLLSATPRPPFYYVTVGATEGTALYSFSLTGFSVTGTEPPITVYVEPIDPVDPNAPVPEPAAWAMMLGGFGLAGGMMRRRRVRVAYA